MKFMCRATGLVLLLTSTLFGVGSAAASSRPFDSRSSLDAVVAGSSVSGEFIHVASYDIRVTPQSGWGAWYHTYNGTITETGRTVSGSVFVGRGNYLADYAGGSGSINDGILGSNTHLFVTRNADDGLPIRPVVTLHLAKRALVESVTIRGGASMFAGAIVAATLGVAGGASARLSGIPSGDPGFDGVLVDDVFTMPSSLAATPTDTVTLSEFSSTLFGQPFDQFTIDEVTVTGTPAASALPVTVDVQPGDSRSAIQPRSRGLTPVAILSTAAFDASTAVVPRTVTFGRTGDEASIARWTITDVNRDRRPDLLLFARTGDLGFVGGETKARLHGDTVDGTAIEGEDAVRVIA